MVLCWTPCFSFFPTLLPCSGGGFPWAAVLQNKPVTVWVVHGLQTDIKTCLRHLEYLFLLWPWCSLCCFSLLFFFFPLLLCLSRIAFPKTPWALRRPCTGSTGAWGNWLCQAEGSWDLFSQRQPLQPPMPVLLTPCHRHPVHPPWSCASAVPVLSSTLLCSPVPVPGLYLYLLLLSRLRGKAFSE